MQLSIQQTKTNFNMAWEVLDKDNQRYAFIDAPLAMGYFEATAVFRNHTPKRLYHNTHDKTWGSSVADRLNLKIFENQNDYVGTMEGVTEKIGFLKSYIYHKIEYKGTVYSAYEVGFGNKGLYLCIYKGDKIIAIVNKKLRVINYKDSYVCYLENEEDADMVISYVVYYDMVSYGDWLDISLYSGEEKLVVTLQKELKAKFVADFIPKIIAQDGYVL